MAEKINTNKKTAEIDIKTKLSTLWIVVMFTMVFADIVGFMNPGMLKDIMAGAVGFKITQEILLVFAVLLEIPIVMIFLSRVLKYRANRFANIIASVITIPFVVGGSSFYLSSIFFTAVEVICMLIIIWTAWKWPKPEVQS